MIVFKVCLILFSWNISEITSPGYKLILKELEKCENPDPPYETNNMTTLAISTYVKENKTIIKGTWTLREDLRGYYWRLQYGTENSGVIKYKLDYKKITCQNMIPKLILMAAKLKYDPKTCTFYKGTYNFDKIDVSRLDQGAFAFPARELGERVLVISFYGPAGTCYCLKLAVEYSMK